MFQLVSHPASLCDSANCINDRADYLPDLRYFSYMDDIQDHTFMHSSSRK